MGAIIIGQESIIYHRGGDNFIAVAPAVIKVFILLFLISMLLCYLLQVTIS
jgi:hypothetical protein